MSNPMIFDFHNHFDFFPSWLNSLTDRFLKNKNDMSFLLNFLEKHDKKIVIGYALYSLPWVKNELSEVISQLNAIDEYIEQTGKEKIVVIRSKEDLDLNFRIGIVYHLESARWFHEDISILDELYSRGVYGLIPVHYKNNWFGGSCDDLSSKLSFNLYQKGLSDQGKLLLEKMNNLNMWLDVSHMNQRTLEDSLSYFDGKIAASHIGLQSIIDVDRNLSEKSIKLIKDKNGLIGICAWSRITGKKHEQLQQMITTLLDYGMEDQIVVGSDFGPPIHTAHGNKNIFDFYKILNNLIDNKEISDKINYKNALGFIKQVLPNENGKRQAV